MRTRQLSSYELLVEWVRDNVLSSVLAVVIMLQVPFTVLYFTSRPQEAVAKQISNPRREASDKGNTKSAVKSQLLPSRPDPFALLPGMEIEKEKLLSNQQSIPPIYDAFGSQPMQAPEGLPVLPKPADMQLQPAPVPAPVALPHAASQLYLIKLAGVVRFQGRAVAIFQMKDKSTVHTFEGERVSGTDCLIQTILPNKVFIKHDINGQVEQDWLFVGEEWRV